MTSLWPCLHRNHHNSTLSLSLHRQIQSKSNPPPTKFKQTLLRIPFDFDSQLLKTKQTLYLLVLFKD
ncbi:hypothetical protein L6452_30840 [Arctium lappa]|uniref:Uncharacterized protein n=1 Tax=Arctium lappa TaxID=4217 RepID=A0ACB8ZKF6_ARCLA|nr:hypothetical protein L6452_30840 [Arctium lappa]